MGNRHYIMEVCQDRANYESKKRELEMEAKKLWEDQQEQHEALAELVDKVNDQARIVEELQRQQQQHELQRGSDTRIPLLQGGSVGSSGSVPMIPNSLHTPLEFFHMEVHLLRTPRILAYLHSPVKYLLQRVKQSMTTTFFN